MISITPSSLIDRAKAAILRGVDSFTRAFLRKSYELAFALAMLTPAFSSRAKKARQARARRFALKVRENTEKHGALGIALMINAGIVTFLSMATIVRYTPKVRESMECTFEGFITKTPEAAKPPGGGGGGSADPVQDAMMKAAAAMPAMATPVAMPSVIHFEAPKAPAVEMPTYTPAVAPVAAATATPAPNAVAGASISADEFAKRLEKLRNRNNGPASNSTMANNGQGGGGTGTGRGSGNGSGTGPGSGSGTGGGNGSGTGPGIGSGKMGGMKIQAERLGVIVDATSSMNADGKITRALNQAKSYKTAFVENTPNSAIDTEFTKSAQRFAENKVEAIYYLTDLEITEPDLARLETILKENGIRLYVHSWKKNPSPELLRVIKESGGGFQLKTRPPETWDAQANQE